MPVLSLTITLTVDVHELAHELLILKTQLLREVRTDGHVAAVLADQVALVSGLEVAL